MVTYVVMRFKQRLHFDAASRVVDTLRASKITGVLLTPETSDLIVEKSGAAKGIEGTIG